MNTELEDRLTEHIQHLADGLPVPAARPEDDLARGRRRRRKQRAGGVAAAAAVVMVVGGTGYLVHDTAGTRTATPAGSGGSAMPSVSPASGKGSSKAEKRAEARKAMDSSPDPRLKRYRAAIAKVIDPSGGHLAKVSGELSGGGVLGTRLGWKDGTGEGEIVVTVAKGSDDHSGFSDFSSWRCEASAAHPCTPVRLPDGTLGRKQVRDGQLGVYHTGADGQVVLIVESKLFGNDSRVPIDALPATAKQLLKAASDPRMTLTE